MDLTALCGRTSNLTCLLQKEIISYTVSFRDQWKMQTGYRGMLEELLKGL